MRILSTVAAVALAIATVPLASAATQDTQNTPIGVKNIVIVHDAFVDGSGWRAVQDILSAKGYNVRVVQQPITTLDADVAATRWAIVDQNGPVILVGHGYGGSVITIAGGRPKVKALVYVAAFQPDPGESVNQLLSSMPQPTSDFKTTPDGHIFFDRTKFAADYAGDVAPERTAFWAISQVPATTAAFGNQPYEVIAWHNKPTYAVVATDDRVVNPDLQRWMYKRAGSKVTEIKASHAVQISQPEAVAKVIEDAALKAR